MEKINAVITGVGGYVPDYILTNDEISKMVDTTDEYGPQSCQTINATYEFSTG